MALYTAQIEKLYVTFFNRPADFSGLAYWEEQMVKTNGDSAVIANAFAASAEYKGLYAGKSTAATIETIYQNLFGRAAEPDAIQYWGVRLDNGTFNIGTIANSIAVGAQNLDKTTIANKVTAATAFTATLDTNAEILGYETTTNGQAVKDWLKAVTSDAATLTNATTALPALVTAVVTNSNANPGTTSTLTKGVDILTGTAGNDTYIADNTQDGTAGAGDQVNGGAGTDTLKLYSAAGATALTLPQLTSVENLYVNGGAALVSNISTVTGLTAAEFDGQTGIPVVTLSGSQALTLSNNAALGATLKYGTTDVAASVTLNNVTTGVVDVQGAALATLSLTASGKNSDITLTNSVGTKVATLNITGDKDLTVTEGLVGLKTVNASTATGKVSIDASNVLNVNDFTFTGGKGNDTLNLGGEFTKADKVNGGEGTDTLAINATSVGVINGYVAVADKAAVNDNLTSVEVLKVTNALAAGIDATRYDAINSYVFGGAFTSTLSAVTSGVSVEFNVATNNASVEITNATLAGNNSDVVNLNLNDTAGVAVGIAFGTVNAVGVDTLNINSTTKAGTVSTGFNTLSVAATSSALDKVVVTGNVGLDITGVALVNSIAEVDASALAVAATANGLKVSIATGGTNGVKITGSAGKDTLVGSDAADIILGGTGDDSITGGLGNDVLTGGAGNDTFVIGAGHSGITSTLFDTITDYSNGTTVATTDTLDFAGTAVVSLGAGLVGWTVTAGVATKVGATLTDFIAAAQLGTLADSVVAFVSGSDTYAYFTGADAQAATTNDALVKLVGLVGVSVVTADTATANEIFIA